MNNLCDTQLPLTRLIVSQHFDTLSDKEKKYAHYISKASWFGSKILASTLSPESVHLLEMFLDIFTSKTEAHKMISLQELKSKSGVDEASFDYFLEYAIQVLYNLGNYMSFGDSKFIPRVQVNDFERIVRSSGSVKAIKLFLEFKNVIYSTSPSESLLLGIPADGHVSGYYSKNISQQDIETVQVLLEKYGVSSLNTRLFKDDKGYTVWISSMDTGHHLTIQENGIVIQVEKGDFQQQMTRIVSNMESALPFAANAHQEAMVKAYISSFKTGSMEDHKESQRQWIKDIGPVVETNIGFIETYKDPAGVRAEWEGFVAVVNKEMTRKFESLVNKAPSLIPLLPWSNEYEKDSFMKPDFTSLEVLTFATSGSPPAGINIPNYDDIRQNLGFKNVSLGNVVSARASKEKITFISSQDMELYEKLRGEAFEVQVGLHELLGHGSGKLLAETEPGVFNFDVKHPPKSPLTGQPIKTWYKPGETWGSVFKSVASSYEECRAELVGMHLCVNRDILQVFGHSDEESQDNIIYVNYLNMARSGLVSLEAYDPKSKKWGQAHCQARFAILQSLIQSKCVSILEKQGSLEIQLDKTKILSHGLPAMSAFLTKLMIYKATADVEQGLTFYQQVTTVNDQWATVYRDIIMKEKQPRKVFVQGNTYLKNDVVELKEYPLTYEGFIQSVIEREI